MADTTPISTPKKKKPFVFKRQAIARKVSDPFAEDESPTADKQEDNDAELDLFKRSKDFFPKAVEEQAKRVKVKERRKSSISEGGDREQQSHKRQKTSKRENEDDDDDIYGVSDREEERRQKGRTLSTSIGPVTPPKSHSTNGASRSPISSRQQFPSIDKGKAPAVPYHLGSPPKKPATRTPTSSKAAPAVICLSDDDDDDDDEPVLLGRQPCRAGSTPTPVVSDTSPVIPVDESFTPPAIIEKDDEDEIMEGEDPEIAKYIARARQRDAMAKRAREAVRNSRDAPVTPTGPGSATAGTPNPEDPVIKVFITSKLHGPPIIPMLATIRLSQAMRVVRKNFINHARVKGLNISESEAESVILTWKGTKLYDSSSAMSLRVTPDAKGRFRGREGQKLGQETKGFHQGGLHFEAWDQRVYDLFLAEKEQARAEGKDDNSDFDDETMPDDPEEKQASTSIKLTLKSKDHEPVRITAHPETSMEIMVSIFRKQRDIPAASKVSLFFDGERLDSALTVGETEIEDMDNLDVHVT